MSSQSTLAGPPHLLPWRRRQFDLGQPPDKAVVQRGVLSEIFHAERVADRRRKTPRTVETSGTELGWPEAAETTEAVLLLAWPRLLVEGPRSNSKASPHNATEKVRNQPQKGTAGQDSQRRDSV